ncbi:hypothetical protein GALMADRAFT_1281379 [Galerina marginata CBS 339.88]|uniref:Protein kinase domain-containing protein n=1 Tax=Galerina marginata (strain CBS 339.88) TaxID=685588 RepID=A0A067T771_GALM3|nr:hypothetical protein GALMADRAFT_1281379 [Galerina marginata CBS 339.88]
MSDSIHSKPAILVPRLERTYYTGLSLQLHSHPPPDLPEDRDNCSYKTRTEPRMTNIGDRLNASVARTVRDPIPNSSISDLSITLYRRLSGSTHLIGQVWTAHVQQSPESAESHPGAGSRYPSTVVAKIYDPVYFEDREAEFFDPFALLDRSVSQETGSYRRLQPLQGVKVPAFYGHFVARLPDRAQRGRTVNVVLLEYVPGNDIRDLVPREIEETLCSPHKDSLIDAALRLYFDILALGVRQLDMQPRNVILPDARYRHHHDNRPFCSTEGCPLQFEAPREDVQLMMVDFEHVDFEEPDTAFSDPLTQVSYVQKARDHYLGSWLAGQL